MRRLICALFCGGYVRAEGAAGIVRDGDESGKSSVQILVAVEGCGVVEAPGTDPVTLAKGERWWCRLRRRISGAAAVVGGISEGIGARRSAARAGNENVGRFQIRRFRNLELPLESVAKQSQFLSRDSRRRPRHPLLAAEPQAPGQAAAGARWQADHDPADSGAPAAAGFAARFWIITNEAFAARNCAPASATAARKQILAEPVGRNTAPAIGLAAFILLNRRSRCGARPVSLRSRDRRREALSRHC